MSTIVQSMAKLEEQLREEGYKGTHKAMRILKSLRLALEDAGYDFETLDQGKRQSKKT